MVRFPKTPSDFDSQALLASLLPAVYARAPASAAWRSVGDAFARALSMLTPEDRVFLKMRLLHGLTVREVAFAFHTDPRALRCRYRRVLGTLTDLVEDIPSTPS